ncbi:MAG: GNAT family N-acetyltransferase [Pseudomonadota bacterium]
MTARRLTADDPDLTHALDVMRAAFAGMEGRIDPPSSITRMTVETLSQEVTRSELWVTGEPVAATVILTPKPPVLYVGKLAVRDRRSGLGRHMMALAEDRARALGLEWLELQSRVELTEVHTVFKRLGFHEVARTTHPGFARPTSITFRKRAGGR